VPAEPSGAACVAYLVTSHARPAQVLRLVRRLRTGSPDAPVVIHHDDRLSRLDEGALAALGGVQLVHPPTAVAWGWASHLDMLLRCVSWLVDRVAFDWMVVLSGQDYPVRPLAEIERDLASGPFDGYVEGEEVAPPPWTRGPVDEFSVRYFYRYRPIRQPGEAVRRALVAARPVLALREMPWGLLLGRRCGAPFTPALRCRRGSDWLSLSRRAAEVVVDAARARPGLVSHYRRTVLPTESFPQTVLHAAPELRLSTDTRRFTSWKRGAAHPEVLRLADLEVILASGADFARKFDMMVDRRVMDELDRLAGCPPP
jgi:Core-2/I-Branching enzyme